VGIPNEGMKNSETTLWGVSEFSALFVDGENWIKVPKTRWGGGFNQGTQAKKP